MAEIDRFFKRQKKRELLTKSSGLSELEESVEAGKRVLIEGELNQSQVHFYRKDIDTKEKQLASLKKEI